MGSCRSPARRRPPADLGRGRAVSGSDGVRRIRALLPMLSVALLPTLWLAVLPGSAAAQAGQEAPGRSDLPGVVGVVTDAETGEPLKAVAVSLRPTSSAAGDSASVDTVVSDARGRFAVRGLADGDYRIDLERIGYRTLSDSISFRAALGLRIQAALVPEAVQLEPILAVVEARSRRLEAAGFYQRRQRGLGEFVTRDQIEERNPVRVTDLLATMAGVRLQHRDPARGGTIVLLRGGCVPEIFLDGVRTMPPFSPDAALHPDDVAGIEVYHSAELPPRFGVSGCGALMIWTHVPNPQEGEGGLSLGEILIPLGVLGALFLLLR